MRAELADARARSDIGDEDAQRLADEERELRYAAVRRLVAQGLAAAAAGDVHPGDATFHEILKQPPYAAADELAD